ncbi:MAG: HAD family hydrolase [Candidatus Dormibacteria bacterium]
MTAERPAVAAVLLDYGGTVAWFEAAAVDSAAVAERVAARLAGAGLASPAAATLQQAVLDRVEREAALHGESGALREIDIVGLERRCFRDLGLELDDAVLDDCARIVQEAWFAAARLYDDVIPALEKLRASGVRCVLCSNAPYRSASLHDQLVHVGIRRHLDGAIFSSEVGWRKPSPQMYDAALRLAGAIAPRSVMVGDRLREDVEGAVAHGLRAVLVDRRATDVGEVDTPVPHLRLPSLAALPAVLDAAGSPNRRSRL